MKNVTITLEEEALRWARREAGEKGTSVSKLVGQMLEREMRQTDSYWRALERLKKIKPVKTAAKMPIPREAAYDRGN